MDWHGAFWFGGCPQIGLTNNERMLRWQWGWWSTWQGKTKWYEPWGWWGMVGMMGDDKDGNKE